MRTFVKERERRRLWFRRNTAKWKNTSK